MSKMKAPAPPRKSSPVLSKPPPRISRVQDHEGRSDFDQVASMVESFVEAAKDGRRAESRKEKSKELLRAYLADGDDQKFAAFKRDFGGRVLVRRMQPPIKDANCADYFLVCAETGKWPDKVTVASDTPEDMLLRLIKTVPDGIHITVEVEKLRAVPGAVATYSSILRGSPPSDVIRILSLDEQNPLHELIEEAHLDFSVAAGVIPKDLES